MLVLLRLLFCFVRPLQNKAAPELHNPLNESLRILIAESVLGLHIPELLDLLNVHGGVQPLLKQNLFEGLLLAREAVGIATTLTHIIFGLVEVQDRVIA